MLNATRDLVLPTTITGSYPRPSRFKSWFAYNEIPIRRETIVAALSRTAPR